MRDGIVDREIVGRTERLRAVDEQGLVERGTQAVGAPKVDAEKLLHQREHAGDLAGGEAGAGLVTPLRAAEVRVRRLRVGEGGRAQGGDVLAGRDEVGLEAAGRALDADADVAAAGEIGHLAEAVGAGIGLRIVGRVGHEAEQLGRADGDDVLGVAGRGDGVRRAAKAAGVGIARITRRENVGLWLDIGAPVECVADLLVVERGVDVVGRDRVAPAVVDDEDVGGEVAVGDEPEVAIVRVIRGVDRERIEPRAGGNATISCPGDGAVGGGRGGAVDPRNGTGHRGAVTVSISGWTKAVDERAAGKLRVRKVHTAVDEPNRHAVTCQPKPITGRRNVCGVRRHIQAHAGKVVHQHGRVIRLDVLHGGQLRQRHQAVGRRGDGDDVAEGERLLALDLRPQRGEVGLGAILRAMEQHQVQPPAGGHRLLPHGEREQLHVEFVERLEGQDAVDARGHAELLGNGRAGAHEVGVVRHVADDFRPGPAEHLAEFPVNAPARLHQPAAGIALRAQMGRDVQAHRLAGLHQRVAQQDGGVTAEQLGIGLGRVAHPERQVRIIAQCLHLGR